MSEEGAEIECLRTAARQNGLVQRRQVLKHGLSARQIGLRLESGRWAEHLPSVYRIGGSRQDWWQMLRGLCLWARGEHALSYRTAAALWELPRFRDGDLEITVNRSIRLPPPIVVHRVSKIRFPDCVSNRGYCVTSPARTLVDLCQAEDAETLESSFDAFVGRELITLEGLAEAMERAGPRQGTAVLRKLIARHDDGEQPTESELELRTLQLIASWGLPRPDKQVWVTEKRRVDLLYVKQRVIIEVTSKKHHFTAQAQENDADRENELALALPGFLLLKWTWLAMKNRPGRLAKQLAEGLARPQLVPAAP